MHLNISGTGFSPPCSSYESEKKPQLKSKYQLEKVILIYSLYDQSTVDPNKDNQNLPSKCLFSCTDPRGVFTNAPRGTIPTSLSICSIVAMRRASSLITGFKEKRGHFKGRAFLVSISENKLEVTQWTYHLGVQWH